MQLTALFVGVGINLIVITLVYIHLNRKIGKRETAGRIISDVRREVDEMIVELNQTTDRNIGIIEERIQRISKAVDEADKRIRLLQKTTDTFTMNTATYSSVRPKVRTQEYAYPQASSQSKGGGELDFGPAPDTRNLKPDTNGTNGTDGKGGTDGSKEDEQQETSTGDRREQVRELYLKGMSAEVIASRLDATVGEVELMITLMEEKDR